MSQNWRTETDAEDFFGHQKKQLDINNRRPLIRRPSDIGLGPGISQSAVRITNFNDLLAQFNGFFSAAKGALNAPNPDNAFVGFVVSDVELGGVQQFYDMGSGVMWRRVFTRNPGDPSNSNAISWGAWGAASVSTTTTSSIP